MYLINLSNFKSRLDWFSDFSGGLSAFLKEHQLDGIELILFEDEIDVPKELVKGLHLRYWPYWMDLWTGDTQALIHNLGDLEAAKMVYGGHGRESLVDRYRFELKKAVELEAEYMVFHVSHIGMHEVFTGDYAYTDEEIIDATIELVNEAFDVDVDIPLLFENLWWPGLRLDKKELIERLFSGVRYKNKGLLLDVSHLSIAQGDVVDARSSLEAVKKTLDELGALKQLIRGVHLNGSFPGDGLSRLQVHEVSPILDVDVNERFKQIIHEISKLDTHLPFHDEIAQEILGLIDPEFVVFEVLPKDLKELSDWILKQNEFLKRP